MTPSIHFVRHAQGFHNLNTANYQIHDPLLTPFGKQQCEHLSRTFPYTSFIDCIIASPLKRTIYTAILSFPSKANLTIIALPEAQETSDLPCDTGSCKEEIAKEFEGKGWNIDLELVVPEWNSKKGKWGTTTDKIAERARVARRWLRERKESNIVVVTHGGLLHYLTEDWTDSEKFEGTGWANTEYRSYTFTSMSDANASIVETEESRTRRRGHQHPLGEAEQRTLSMTKPVGADEKEAYKHDSSKEHVQAKV